MPTTSIRSHFAHLIRKIDCRRRLSTTAAKGISKLTTEPTRLTKIAQPATAKLGMSTIADQGLDYSKMPYNRLQPMGMIPDLVVPGVLHAVRDPLGSDPRLWVPLSNTVSFHPIHFNVSPGFYAHVMRVTQGGVLSRYRHTGGVHALVLKGRWHYLATGLPKKVHTRLSRPARRTP